MSERCIANECLSSTGFSYTLSLQMLSFSS